MNAPATKFLSAKHIFVTIPLNPLCNPTPD